MKTNLKVIKHRKDRPFIWSFRTYTETTQKVMLPEDCEQQKSWILKHLI